MDLLMIAELSPLAFSGALLAALAARLSGLRARRALACFAGMALSLAAARGLASVQEIAAKYGVESLLFAGVMLFLALYHAVYVAACCASISAARCAFAVEK